MSSSLKCPELTVSSNNIGPIILLVISRTEPRLAGNKCDVQNIFSIVGKVVSNHQQYYRTSVQLPRSFSSCNDILYGCSCSQLFFKRSLCWWIWGACLLWKFANELCIMRPQYSWRVSNWSSFRNLSINYRTMLRCGTWDSRNIFVNFSLISSVYSPLQRNTCCVQQKTLGPHVSAPFSQWLFTCIQCQD
jgi:hypothetical protein